MLKEKLITAVLIVLAFELMAYFPDDFQEAKKLFNTHKNKEAQEVFQKLASTAPTPESKAKCLSYAAKALGRDKTQYEAAMEAAKKIKDREISVLARIDIMKENHKIRACLDEFKDEDFEGWSDVHRLKACIELGGLALSLGRHDAAQNYSLKAIEISGSDSRSRILALGILNAVYFAAEDYENVLKTSNRILAMKEFNGFFPFSQAVLIRSQALLRLGKPDEAAETLKIVDQMKRTSPNYKCQVLIIRGDVHAARGEMDEAAAMYKGVMTLNENNDVADSLIKQARSKLATLNRE